MCSHYQAAKARRSLERMGIQLPDDWVPPPGPDHVWPGYRAPFIRRPRGAHAGDTIGRHEVLDGVFGLLPFWAKDEKLARSTYNARTESVTTKPSFRDAWKRAQHCIIPIEAFYEPDWRSGKAVPMRICRADGEPFGLAGLWERWVRTDREVVLSFTMLTVNADGHELMQKFHKPGDEKRMVVVLPAAHYEEWLDAPADKSMAFMARCRSELLVAEVDPTT